MPSADLSNWRSESKRVLLAPERYLSEAMATRVPLEEFAASLGGFIGQSACFNPMLSYQQLNLPKSMIELSSVALGASIVSCSDEFFAPASDLLKVAVS